MGYLTSPLDGPQRLCAPPKQASSPANIFHSLLRKVETGQASGHFIRGTSGHISTVLKQELKRCPWGKPRMPRACVCKILEEKNDWGLEQQGRGWVRQSFWVKARALLPARQTRNKGPACLGSSSSASDVPVCKVEAPVVVWQGFVKTK